MAINGKAVWATASGQTVYGTVYDDMLGGYWGGSTTLYGGAGNDTYYIYNPQNLVFENANEGTDTVVTIFNYTLGSNLENLTLANVDIAGIGNSLNNIMIGQDGRQTFYGAGGNDILTGGAGSDVFIVKSGSGSDTITDFNGGDGDMVRLGSYGFSNFSSVLGKMTQSGSNVVLRLSASENLTFANKTVASFASDDFQYAINTANYTLAFADNFNDLNLQSDGGVWRTWLPDWTGGRGLGSTSGELQAYMDKDFLGLGVNPFSVSNGQLTIHAEKASVAVKAATGRDYTSGLLTTRDAYAQTYGYFEIKCQLPAGAGTWPAFWLLPASGAWPPELDVMEELGGDTSTIYTTAHSSKGGHTQTGASSWVGDVSDGMHSYGVLWTATDLVWYVDGVEVFRAPTPSDMHGPMYMVTNLAIGGWAGTPGAGFTGADMIIDYIKAYSLTDPSPDTGTGTTTSDLTTILADTVTTLVLTGFNAVDGTGNSLDNIMTGNSADNHLYGLDGADTLNGGAGHDWLDGGTSVDTMSGGTGNDTYVVDAVTDLAIEAAGEGTDLVYASVSYGLGDHVENLVLTGTTTVNGTGNALNNSLTGNAARNVLTGGDGDDTLDGGGGGDSLIGGAGNDSYIVRAAGDFITEDAGSGSDTVYSAITYTLSANVETLVLTGSDTINATGNALANTLTGNSGNNALSGGAGNDTMAGGAGDDAYFVDSTSDVVTEAAGAGIDWVYATASFTLGDNVEKLTLQGTANINGTGNTLDNVLNGNSGNNVLTGGGGNDTFWGGAGIDTMIGGSGNDNYYADAYGDVVTEATDSGVDTVYATTSFVLSANIENLTLQGTGDYSGTGNALNNNVTGNSGHNWLSGGVGNDNFWGGLGNDTMLGGAGNDTFYVDASGDVVTEYAGEGTDTVYASVSYTIGNNIENLSLQGTSDLSGTGNAGDNSLTGNAGNNLLSGGGGNDNVWGGLGNDTMLGGAGNDTYYVDAAGDVVTEYTGEGTDTVYASVSYTIGNNIENLSLQGTADINATGNSGDNNMTGNAGNNLLTGGGGNDNVWGGLGNDTMIGGTGNDTYYADAAGDKVTEETGGGSDVVYASVSYTLSDNIEKLVLQGAAGLSGTGNAGDNSLNGNDAGNLLTGGGGNDTFWGGLGNDTLVGGSGNDLYYVDASGDVVSESADGGSDIVYATASFVIGENIESLTLTGSANINGTGNAGNNSLTGNSGHNLLIGGGGNDNFWGGLGNDTLVGGSGNDTYYADAAGDVVTEDVDGGTDVVYATASFTIGDNIENLTLTGTADISGTGNAGNNNLTGNSGNNWLIGGGGNDNFWGGLGNDSMVGGLGNDSYYIDASGDVVTEGLGGGSDVVYASASYTLSDNIESLNLQGTAAINATGNGFDNALNGNGGDNWLTGGGGSDSLYGGAGSDTFVLDQGPGLGVDRIWDFAHGVDHLALLGSAFGLGTGALSEDAFCAGKTAHDGDDHVIYTASNGNLYFDADGNGSGVAVLIAQLSANLSLTASDFLVL